MNLYIILENGNSFIFKNIKRFEYKRDELIYYLVDSLDKVYKFADADIYNILIAGD